MGNPLRNALHHAPLLVPLLSSAIVHSVALTYSFMRDDFLHLYQVANLPLAVSLITPHGGHLCTILNLVFYGFLQLFGVTSLPHAALALVTHLVNVALLYYVLLLFTHRRGLACIFSTLWGICPGNQGSLGYFSVYGHVIAVTFVLLSLLEVGRLRARHLTLRTSAMVRWLVLLIGASLSFGVGIGVAMASGAVVWCLLYGAKERLKATVLLLCLLAVVPAMYYGTHSAYYETRDGLSDGFNEPSWHQPHLSIRTAAVQAGLIGYGFASLLFGTLLVAWPAMGQPLLYVAGAVACVSTCFVLWRGPTEVRYQVAGFLTLLLSVSGVIALARAGLLWREGLSFFQIVGVPRYCYSLSMVSAILLALGARAAWTRAEGGGMRGVLLGSLGVFALGMVGASQRAAKEVLPLHRLDPEVKREYQAIMQGVSRMASGIPAGGTLYVRNAATSHITIATLQGVDVRFPGAAAVFVIGTHANEIRGRRVFFVERDGRVVEAARAKMDTRISRLLVTEEEASGATVLSLER